MTLHGWTVDEIDAALLLTQQRVKRSRLLGRVDIARAQQQWCDRLLDARSERVERGLLTS